LHTAPTVDDHFTAPERQSRDARLGHERFHDTSVGDVRPRFISLHEGLRLTRSSSSPPSDWPSSSEGTSGEHRPPLRSTGATPCVPVGTVNGQSPVRFRRVRWPRSPSPARSGR